MFAQPLRSSSPDLYHGKYVASLFASGEQGAWYDPSDLTTMFQDAAGTTPVAGVEQPVGRILDKSGRGNHATQTTTASRPVLSARVNLLQKTEQFNDSYWLKDAGVTVTPNQEIAPDGTLSADLISLASGSRALYRLSPISFTPTLPATRHSFWVKAAPGFSGAKIRYVFVKRPDWIVIDVTLTNSWQQVLVDASPSTNDTHNAIEWGNRASGTGFPAVSFYLWGADLRVANEPTSIPSYQRVNTATDYDTQGFPLYLRFDGVDDSLVTPSINFTSTDKMTVFTADHSAWDGQNRLLAGLSSQAFGFDGTFWLSTYDWGFSAYAIVYLRGNLRGAAPYGNDQRTLGVRRLIRSVRMDIGKSNLSEEVLVRVNGNAQVLAGAPLDPSAGTGNFGNHQLYIGRLGSAYPFNGRLYGLIVRGAQTDSLHLTNVERYLANKSGVTL